MWQLPAGSTRSSWFVVLLALVATTRAGAEPDRPAMKGAALGPVYLVTEFGAVEGGQADCTAAIDKAVRAAAGAGAAGGAVVRVPAGRWLTGAVELRSNVVLELQKGAVLVMSTDPDKYPVVRTRWDGVDCENYSGLVFARDAENVTVQGPGLIDGQGPRWWPWRKWEAVARQRLVAGSANVGGASTGGGGGGAGGNGLTRAAANATPAKPRRFGTLADGLRPSLVEFVNCRNVVIDGVSIKDSPRYGVHAVNCAGVTCRDLTVAAAGPDTDGIVPDSSRDVLIERCKVDLGNYGAGVALRAGRAVAGATPAPCENVLVSACEILGGHSGIDIGAAQTAGGVRNVAVSGCRVEGAEGGVRVRTGTVGEITGVSVTDCRIERIAGPGLEVDVVRSAVTGPRNPVARATAAGALAGRASDGVGVTPTGRDTTAGLSTAAPGAAFSTSAAGARVRFVRFLRVACKNLTQAVRVRGAEGLPVDGLVLADVSADAAERGADIADAVGGRIEGMRLVIDPKSGPALTLARAANWTIERLDAANAPETGPLISLKDAADITVRLSRAPGGTGAFVRLSGAHVGLVKLSACDLRSARRPFDRADEVPAGAVVTVE